MNMRQEARQAATLLLTGAGASVMLMLHHPTSLNGPDDGLLMPDWSNAGVHGGMIACLLAIGLGGSSLPRWLGETHLSARAGGMAFGAGVGAFVVAGLVNGFAVEGAGSPAAARGLFALNQTFAVFGMALTALALSLWAIRMLRLTLPARAAAIVGLMAGAFAVGWLTVGEGRFGLLPAVVATGVFAAWSVLTAIALWRSEGQNA